MAKIARGDFSEGAKIVLENRLAEQLLRLVMKREKMSNMPFAF
jgi:hypothetical protein